MQFTVMIMTVHSNAHLSGHLSYWCIQVACSNSTSRNTLLFTNGGNEITLDDKCTCVCTRGREAITFSFSESAHEFDSI